MPKSPQRGEAIQSLASRPNGATRLTSLTVIPGIWSVASISLVYRRPPAWQFMDPTYTYLVNSVEFSQGMAAAHYHHPGFPVYWFLGPIVRLAGLIIGGSDPGQTLVTNTALLMSISAVALVLLQACALVWVSLSLNREFGFTSAVLFQGSAIATGAFSSTVGPVGLQTAVTMSLFALLVPRLGTPKKPLHGAEQLLLGTLLAVALLTKLTSLPLFAFLVPLIPLRQYLRVIIMSGVFFLLGSLITVREGILDMLVFFARVLPGTGRRPDEAGGSLLDGLSTLPSTLVSIAVPLALLITSLILLLVLPPISPFTGKPIRFAVSVVLSLATGLMMSIKAFQSSDFVPVTLTIVLLVAVTYAYVAGRFTGFTALASHLAALGVSSVLLFSSLFHEAAMQTDPVLKRDQLEAVSYLEQRLVTNQPTLTTNSIPTPGTALFFGLGWSQRSFASQLIQEYPGYLNLNLQNGLIYIYGPSGEIEATCSDLQKLANGGNFQFMPGREYVLPAKHPQYESVDVVPAEPIGGWNISTITRVDCLS